MPALKNPRHEAFAQAIFSGIINAKGGAHSQAEAYRRAGYNVTNGNSARACASRLLTFANGIAERIKELQAIAAEQTVESAEKMTRELNEVLREARADKAHSAAVSAILGKAKILNIGEQHDFRSGQIDFSQASSMQDNIVIYAVFCCRHSRFGCLAKVLLACATVNGVRRGGPIRHGCAAPGHLVDEPSAQGWVGDSLTPPVGISRNQFRQFGFIVHRCHPLSPEILESVPLSCLGDEHRG